MTSPNRHPELSVSIVNYNTRDTTIKAISALKESISQIDSEAILVDNGSTDGSVEAIRDLFPDIQIITNKENRYFTYAHNQAFRLSLGQYVLIMNSDLLPNQTALEALVDLLRKDSKAGAVGCMVLHEGRRPRRTIWTQPGLLDLMRSLHPWRFLIPHPRPVSLNGITDSANATVISDSFLLVRKDVLDAIGLYDESFKLYYTEDDLCARIHKHGYGIVFRDDLTVNHLSGMSVGKVSRLRIAWLFLHDMWTYATKHLGFAAAVLLLPGMTLHLVWIALSALFRRPR